MKIFVLELLITFFSFVFKIHVVNSECIKKRNGKEYTFLASFFCLFRCINKTKKKNSRDKIEWMLTRADKKKRAKRTNCPITKVTYIFFFFLNDKKQQINCRLGSYRCLVK